jgi:hypothetical protein
MAIQEHLTFVLRETTKTRKTWWNAEKLKVLERLKLKQCHYDENISFAVRVCYANILFVDTKVIPSEYPAIKEVRRFELWRLDNVIGGIPHVSTTAECVSFLCND